MDSTIDRARRDYHSLVTNTVRFALWVAFWGLASTAVSIYLTWNHSRGAQMAIAAAALVAGGAFAFLLPFLWMLLVAPHRIVRDELKALNKRVVTLEGTSAAGKNVDPLRVALMAVRSELGASGTRISEALTRKRWWMPDTDPLPSEQWTRHFGVLSDPVLPTQFHAQIEMAYQQCDRLNHRIKRYLAEQKDANPVTAAFVSGNYSFRNGDEEVLREGLKTITDANGAISERIDATQG